VAQYPGTAHKVLILLAASMYLVACGPEKTVQWSADGKHAAIVSGGSLYLSDDQGNLSNPTADGVERVAWLPDSSRLVVVCKRELDAWDELVSMAPLGFDEKKIIAAAMTAKNEFSGYEGKLDDFRPSNAGSLTTEQWAAAVFYLKFLGDPGFKEKLGDGWKEIENMKAEVRTVRVMPASADPAENGISLFATLEEMDELRMAPDGGALAFVTRRGEGFGDGQVRSLSVIAARAGGKPVLVADRVSDFPDWSPDSRDLVYIRCETKDTGEMRLGRITRRTVRDTQGAILENPSDAVDLAMVIFRDTLKVRCLLDGRILFAAAEAALPAGNNQIVNRLTLFSLDPGQAGSVSRILPRSMDQNLPDRADLFEVSPDGRYIAVPGSKGRISKVTLATGEVTAIIGKDSSEDLRTIPVWRNSQQLCLVAPAGSGYASSKRDEVILWSEGQATIVSQSWPNKVLEGIK
jgi:hypothetical protein